MAPLIIGWRYFPEYRGRVTGTIIAGSGLGACIFYYVSTSLVNPHNLSASVAIEENNIENHYFPFSVARRVPYMLRWLSAIYLTILIVAIVLLRDKKTTDSQTYIAKEPILPSLKSKTFCALQACFFCSVIGGLYVAFTYKNFGSHTIDDDQFLSLVGSVSLICNSLGRIVWGSLLDRYSFKTIYTALLIAQLCFLGSFYFIAFSKAAFLIWVTLILCFEGGNLIIFPTILSYVWGKELGARLYGIFAFCSPVSLGVCYGIQLFVVPYWGYLPMYILLTGLNLISLFINLKLDTKSASTKTQDQQEIITEKSLLGS